MKNVARFLGFAFANADLLVELDADLRIEFAAGAAQSLLGTDPTALAGRPLRDILAAADRGVAARALRGLGSNQRLTPRFVGALRQDDGGDIVPCQLGAYRLEGGSHCFATLTRARGGLATPTPESRNVDATTGVQTAGVFADTLARRFGLEPEGAARQALTLLRIDNLGEVRARLDPEALHRLMEEVGGILRYHAGDGAAGRLADDRFGIVHDAIESVGEAVRQELAQAGDGAGLSASMATLDPQTMELSREDAGRVLMHVLKRFAEGELDPASLPSGATLSAVVRGTVERVVTLRTTLAEKRLALHYQPIVRLRDGTVQHYEALLRLDDGAPTASTVGFAEQVGMAADLDLLVVATALAALPDLPAGTRLAVNLSGVSVSSDLFLQTLDNLLRRHATKRGQILFEITESAQIQDLARAATAISGLRRQGHAVCLDDFGTGAAQLPYLQALEVDYIKLDGSYVDGLGRSKRDDALLRGLFHMLGELGVGTIAERVETQSQADGLQAMGCTYAQGWLFGKPAPVIGPQAPTGSPPTLARVGRRRGTTASWG